MLGGLGRGLIGVGLTGLAAMLSGCTSLPEAPSLSSLTSIFKEEEKKLPGERIPVIRSEIGEGLSSIEAKEPVNLPPQKENPAWTQPGGVPNNAPGHLALSGSLSQRWRADAGAGSSSDGRLTAIPIVADGRVFTLDTEGAVSAFSAGSGQLLWRTKLVPDGEDEDEGFGGGLALEGDKLFAATGFGTVVALSKTSGKILWQKSLGLPFRTSPTVASGKVFVVNAESRLYCFSAEDGTELWTARGLPESAAFLSNASPAVSGDTVVVPYPSGELLAFDVETGQPKWTDTLSRSRLGSAMTSLGDTARPVIDGDEVFAVSSVGRMIATNRKTGARIWSRDIRSSQMPWVSGDTVFVLEVTGKLVALRREDGKIRWVTSLPNARYWNGPVLANGKLWTISNKGLLVGLDARTGAIASKRDLDEEVYIPPVVASNRMYVLTDSARLLAIN